MALRLDRYFRNPCDTMEKGKKNGIFYNGTNPVFPKMALTSAYSTIRKLNFIRLEGG